MENVRIDGCVRAVRKPVGILIIAAVALLGSAATAAASEWAPTDYIVKRVEPTQKGWIWVLFSSSMSGIDGCDTYSAVVQSNYGSEEGRDRVYRGLLAAMLSGKKVRPLIYANGPNDDCSIDRIRISD